MYQAGNMDVSKHNNQYGSGLQGGKEALIANYMICLCTRELSKDSTHLMHPCIG